RGIHGVNSISYIKLVHPNTPILLVNTNRTTMRMASPAYPSFIAGAGITTPLRKRARIRARPVTGFFEASTVTYIDRFLEFFIFDFHIHPHTSQSP
ncbi:MAG: hypothetical protein M0Z50_01310, partial [Planctomycetia bacterium]|nr:hypothetical protein [Planctomycetia bacterium]